MNNDNAFKARLLAAIHPSGLRPADYERALNELEIAEKLATSLTAAKPSTAREVMTRVMEAPRKRRGPPKSPLTHEQRMEGLRKAHQINRANGEATRQRVLDVLRDRLLTVPQMAKAAGVTPFYAYDLIKRLRQTTPGIVTAEGIGRAGKTVVFYGYDPTVKAPVKPEEASGS